MSEKPSLAFVRDPDQPLREAEFARFVARNPAPFLASYRVFRDDNAVGQRPKFRLGGYGFCLPAFLFGPVWFLYRKMWLVAGILVALEISLRFIPGTNWAELPIEIACSLLARRIYVHGAVNRIAQARRPDGSLDETMIARYGGVSRVAAWIGGIVTGLVVVGVIARVVLLMQAGAPLPA